MLAAGDYLVTHDTVDGLPLRILELSRYAGTC